MSGQNSENLASDKMTGSYVLALKHNNNTNKDNAEPDGEIFNVKPVFILESDIFGSSKPDKNNYLTHTELFKCIDLTIPANHLNGIQRVIGGVWRIYPDSEEDRESLVVNSITVRKKRIEVYPRNPKYVEKESPITVRIRIKNIPLSADDGQLVRYLQNWHLEVLNYHRERLRIDGFLKNCQTGDRIFHCEPFLHTIPRNVKIGKYRGLIFYKGQINQNNTEIECTKCLQKGHKKQTVTMTGNARHVVQMGTSLRTAQLSLMRTVKLTQKCRQKSQMKQVKMNLRKVRRLFYHNRPNIC
ncbi:unnamed protein product [Mytilus coruscus]|uniref:Uncharacterized protein n=1 Tax=Mytilus coruscus TaxID=42192 RepID=A0A6J8DCF1_MYTCO|nr:unnamed protein product [Mytilus coruscus]